MSEVQDAAGAARALASVPMFAALDAVDLAKLAGVLEERWYDPGDTLFEAGGEGDGLYILREGIAQRRVSGSAVGNILPFESFGQLALLTEERRSASVVALTAVRVWVLPRGRFFPLLRGEPELMLHLGAAIGTELAQARRALGDLQAELDGWVRTRLAALDEDGRACVEIAALVGRASAAVLLPDQGEPMQRKHDRLAALAGVTPLLAGDEGHWIVPAAIRSALLRLIDEAGRRSLLAARLCETARALEQAGLAVDAIEAWRGAGAEDEVQRVIASLRRPAEAMQAGSVAQPPSLARDGPGARARARAANDVGLRGRLLRIAIGLSPLLAWGTVPPEGLGPAGWHALLTVVSAALLFATEALPDEVVSLGLLCAWVVGGVVPARVALDGFASPAWVLVLAVLAVGVAVGNTGLLYRVALAALGRRPAGFARRCFTLALVGTAVTPTLPNATSRTALAAPMVREVAEALGYPMRSRAATGLALAGLLGFGQMAGLFLTGSSVGVLVHGLLPAEVRERFGFIDWFVAALPLHLVLFGMALAAIVAIYRPRSGVTQLADRLALQRAVLGPMRRDEWLCLLVLAGLIAGFVTERLHGINGAWLGVGAIAVLAAGRALDTTMMRSGVNWPFLLFFGAVASMAGVFSSLGVDQWLGARLAAPLGGFAGGGAGFCLLLAIVGFVLSFVVRWQAAAPLLTLVAMPVAASIGVHPFIAAVVSLVSTQVWFLPYQSTVYLALYHGSGECWSHESARPMALLWGALVLLSIALAVPVWRAMGLMP